MLLNAGSDMDTRLLIYKIKCYQMSVTLLICTSVKDKKKKKTQKTEKTSKG